MNFDTRMLPSMKSAIYNYIVIVKDDDKIVGYVYSNGRRGQLQNNKAEETSSALLFCSLHMGALNY